jgi:formiminoglutamate deiminase
MRFFAERALLPSGLAERVRFEIADGRFTAVTPNSDPADALRLPGIVLPGFADGHSHAFHRALRGRTHNISQRGQGGSLGSGDRGNSTFWTWRRAMYSVAARLDPDSYLALARAAYAEMACAGITGVAEFHYVHHQRDGTPYADPNSMGAALVQAAHDAGIRLTLLDTCYLSGGLDGSGYRVLDDHQRRFGDRDVDAWAARMADRPSAPGVVLGAAVHSVRAVPDTALPTVVEAARGLPLHVHLSEQRAENEACLAFHGVSPTTLLDRAGVLGPATTAVHATHLDAHDIAALGRARVHGCLCPTTERDLADGIGPAHALQQAGATLCLGSDQHVVTDPFEEARGLESHERLLSGRRDRFTQPMLLAALTDHAALGVLDAGRLAVGARADLVAVGLDTMRTAGIDPAQVLAAAGAPDVDTVVVDGRVVVEGGRHVLGDIARLLDGAITPLWQGDGG